MFGVRYLQLQGGTSKMPIILPVTLMTGSALAFLCLALVVRVGQGRFVHNVSIGDGGNADLLMRMRTHANFVEYVPFILMLMALLELGGAHRTVLAWFGCALVAFRVLHAIGMPRSAPNPYRAIGALGTVALLLAIAVYGVVLSLAA